MFSTFFSTFFSKFNCLSYRMFLIYFCLSSRKWLCSSFVYHFAWRRTKHQGCHGGLSNVTTKSFHKIKNKKMEKKCVKCLWDFSCKVLYSLIIIIMLMFISLPTYRQVFQTDTNIWHVFWHITDTQFKLFPDRCIFCQRWSASQGKDLSSLLWCQLPGYQSGHIS